MTDNNLSQLELIRQTHERVMAIDDRAEKIHDKQRMKRSSLVGHTD